MELIKIGMLNSVVMLLVFCVLVIVSIKQNEKGKKNEIRRLPAIDAIEEAVGRAAEMGKPLHFSTGMGQLLNKDSPQTFAALNILNYTANEAAKRDVQIIYNCAVAHVLPVVQDIITTAYNTHGARLDDSYTFRYVGDDQRALMAACMGTFERDKPAANILVGALYYETVTITGHAARSEMLQIGGTGRMYNIGYLVAACDYVLIAEELFAVGAYISKNPSEVGGIRGQDLCKVFVIGAILVTLLFNSIGIDLFVNLLGL